MTTAFATRVRSFCAIAATLVVAGASPVAAQRANRLQEQPGAPGQQGALELQFRQRLAEVVRRRLNLNDGQMRQLGQTNDKFERQRMQLLREERRVRQALRAEVLAGDSADQPKVAGLIDQTLRIQRQRLDLTENEQRELATFMTPMQRAKYFGIQDQLRRRMEELREQRQQRQQRQQQRRGAGGVVPNRQPLP